MLIGYQLIRRAFTALSEIATNDSRVVHSFERRFRARRELVAGLNEYTTGLIVIKIANSHHKRRECTASIGLSSQTVIISG